MRCAQCGAVLRDPASACTDCGAAPVELAPRWRRETEDEEQAEPDLEVEPLLLGEGDPFGIGEGDSRLAGAELGEEPSGARSEIRSGPRSAPRRAPFATRAIALSIDLVVLALANFALLALATAAVMTADRVTGRPLEPMGELVAELASTGALALAASYFAWLHAAGGQTLGKAALGIRVERLRGGGIGGGQSLLRLLGYLLSLLPLATGFLLALGPSRRALHDYVAGTVVVRVDREP